MLMGETVDNCNVKHSLRLEKELATSSSTKGRIEQDTMNQNQAINRRNEIKNLLKVVIPYRNGILQRHLMMKQFSMLHT